MVTQLLGKTWEIENTIFVSVAFVSLSADLSNTDVYACTAT